MDEILMDTRNIASRMIIGNRDLRPINVDCLVYADDVVLITD